MLYAAGYREAASVLVGHIESRRRHQDALVYPILFLYRQYLELKLKSLIRDVRGLLENPGRVPQTHKIDELWNTCRPLLLEIEPKGDKELQRIDALITEFSRIDPTSTAFRYPEDRSGGASLPGVSRINLRHVRDLMEDGADLFDAADSMVDVYRSAKSDYLEVVNDLIGEQQAIECEMEELYTPHDYEPEEWPPEE